MYRVWQRQKRNIEEKREAATKKQFSLLLSSVFSWSADSEQALLGPYDSDAFVHCARADRGRQHGQGGSEVNGLQEERSVCGGIINNILSAFCVKFADFFLSVSLAVPVVFRLLFLQSDAECGTAAIFGACFNDSRSSFVNF